MYRFRHQYLGCCLCGAGADRLGPASAAQDPASLSGDGQGEGVSLCQRSVLGGDWGGGTEPGMSWESCISKKDQPFRYLTSKSFRENCSFVSSWIYLAQLNWMWGISWAGAQVPGPMRQQESSGCLNRAHRGVFSALLGRPDSGGCRMQRCCLHLFSKKEPGQSHTYWCGRMLVRKGTVCIHIILLFFH